MLFFLSRKYRLKISTLSFKEGRAVCIFKSNLPALVKDLSTIYKRLVAPMTKTWSLDSNPSS